MMYADTPTSFYCIVLLTALFVSSCYWQPLPIYTPLSTPWSENITTFSEALNVFIPNYEHDFQYDDNNRQPTVVRLMDRCWCDFSSGNLFEPFNVTRWELASVRRFAKELVRDRERAKEKEREREVGKEEAEARRDNISLAFAATTPPGTKSNADTPLEKEQKGTFEAFRSAFWRAPSSTATLSNSPSPLPSETDLPAQRRPVASGEIDLEPYGFDLVLDFRWTR
jgi:hypothetical protein